MPDNINNEINQLYTDSQSQQAQANNRTDTQILLSIEQALKDIAKNGNMSASNAQNRYGNTQSTFFQDRRSIFRGSASQAFSREFRDTIMRELVGDDFKKALNGLRDQVAKDLGVELGDLPKSLGKMAGEQLSKSIKDTKLGDIIFGGLKKRQSDLAKKMTEAYTRGAGKSVASNASNAISKSISDALGEGNLESVAGKAAGMADTIGGADAALGGLTEVVKTIGPEFAGAAVATGGLLIAVDLVSDALKKKLKPAIDATKELLAKLGETTARYEKSREANLDASRKRLEADIRTMAEAPFKILEEAAEAWYNTWDNTLRTISATQGYNKEQVQSLYAAFADRLRNEGLTDVIGATDIVNNLENVLKSGLQGAAAEEFAYVATKLNAAVPTQDFFNYTEGYITAVSNAMQQGKSQAEALQIANAELETFASNLLYAGREVAGGFTTGLKGAEGLFKQAEQIAQAGRSGTSGSALGSVLTSVAAITGAIAPDLASSITDVLYKAAVGGNSSELVALRSLAGINASNTEFLQALITDPHAIFSTIFGNLSKLQNMANGAYMEVAEGLSSVFGVSMDSLARIDFKTLSDAVAASSETNSALLSNMKLLQSGQTTTNAEILKYRQINQYMVEEGLGYVLDNEAARAIQQHLWEEQIARELMETTYGVELTGTALKALEKISGAVQGVMNIFNPGAWAAKGAELVATTQQESALRNDIAKILELGKVGAGNVLSYSQLTTYNQKQQLTDTLVELLGGRSSYKSTQAAINKLRNRNSYAYTDGGNVLAGLLGRNQSITNKLLGVGSTTGAITSSNAITSGASILSSALNDVFSIVSGTGAGISSAYRWNRVGKSALSRFGASPLDYIDGTSVAAISTVAASQTQSRLTSNLQKMLDAMEEYYNEDTNRSYADYVATAKQYGISDFTKALEENGLTSEAVENKYLALQSQSAGQEEAKRKNREEDFWNNNINNLVAVNSWLDSLNSTATNICNIFDKFLKEWEDYFINHTVYNNAYTRDSVQKVLDAERDSSETAIYALADALTQNDVGLLLDPTVQTNALLAQILKVANAILTQQGNNLGGVSLPDTLAGLSLGIINQ